MKKLFLAALLTVVAGITAFALTVPAQVDGVKVWLKEYQLKKPFSELMANATVEAELDLTEGVGDTLSTPFVFDEVDVMAAELSITFDNAKLQIKAYAEDSGTYYYTTAAGVADTTDALGTWADYGFLDVGAIYPGGDERYVSQSYFPVPVLIEADSTHVIHGLVNLEYSVFFWDGNDQPVGNASWTGAVFPAANPVLALDTELTSEVYLFANASADLNGSDISFYRAMALYFDDSGNLQDGSGKGGTGYSVQSGTSVVGAWKRIGATASLADGTMPFSIARDYDDNRGEYYYEHAYTGFKRISETDMALAVEKTFPVTVAGTSYTISYRRVK